jgi:hypothetical protein
MLADLLPLYAEIKSGNNQILQLVSSINAKLTGKTNSVSTEILENNILSEAQEAFLECVGVN